MNNNRIRIAVVLTLGLVALGTWRHQVTLEREAQARLFFSYVDGPLNDYALAVTRALPVAFRGGKGGYAEGAMHAARSLEELKQLIAGAPQGWILDRLNFVLPWHEKLAALIAAPPKNKAGLAAWLSSEKEIRDKIIYTLEDVRFEAYSRWKISQSKFLELNALIFSLKEAQDSAAN